MEDARGPRPQFWAGQETRVLEAAQIAKFKGSMRMKGLNVDFCPAVPTGSGTLETSAGVMAGGLAHINQCT
eukprot:965119-Pyramimonas_sp.AAC.1